MMQHTNSVPPRSSSSALVEGVATALGIGTTANEVDAVDEFERQRLRSDMPHDKNDPSLTAVSVQPTARTAAPLPPVQAIPIEFTDLCYDVKVLKRGARKPGPLKKFAQGIGLAPPEAMETLRVLHSISGRIPPGELCALMGASGAGKSTLLNMLSGRASPSSGSVTFAGNTADSESLASVSAFVQQLDMFLGNLTPQEHLKAQCRLRLNVDIPPEQREKDLDDLLVRMNLVKCRANQIAVAHGSGGISGGEKKRLNVASEIITSPSILFADEPTTGLDSFMALSIVDVLKEMADSGRTVVATIHQPSSKIFEKFSQLILLGEGRLLYCGPRDGCVAWFSKLGHHCPATTNPADFLVKLAALPEKDEMRERKIVTLDRWSQSWAEQGAEFITAWEKEGRKEFRAKVESKRLRDVSAIVPDQKTASSFAHSQASSFMLNRDVSWAVGRGGQQDSEKVKELLEAAHRDSRRPNWFQQVGALYWRATQANKRDRLLLHARAMQTLIFALLYSTLTFRADWEYAGSRSRAGVAYAALLNQSMSGAMGVVNTFGHEIPIVKREFESGVLSPSAYIIAKMLADMPIQIIFPFVFTTILHWVSGARDDFVRYLAHVGIVLLAANSAMSLGYFASSIASDPDMGPLIVNLTTLPIVQFGGFMVKLSDTRPWIRWIQWISFVKYSFFLSLSNLFGGDAKVKLLDGSWRDGTEFIKSEYDVHIFSYAFYIIILVVMLVFMRTVTCVAFTRSLRKRKENQ